jgi:hypothetical protein
MYEIGADVKEVTVKGRVGTWEGHRICLLPGDPEFIHD